MRLLHLADLHLGKRVNGFSMIEDQRAILEQILNIAEEKDVQAALLCGDIYDKPVPSEEAVRLFDWFLTELRDRKIPVLLISGNHDSGERLNFGARIMEQSNVYFAGAFHGVPEPVCLQDEFGPVHFYLLPFIRPADVRHVWPEAQISSAQEAVAYVLEQIRPDPAARNVLLAHQFVTGALRSESEDVIVGTLDGIDAAVFSGFDYTALGHIHRAQSFEKGRVRYCGTPLKYSFSEANHEKSVTIAELGPVPDGTQAGGSRYRAAGQPVNGPSADGQPREAAGDSGKAEFRTEKCDLTIEAVPLTPLRDLREIRGSYEELCDRRNYIGTNTEDYLHITLTDEHDIINVMSNLRTIYPNIMKLDYDNVRTRSGQSPATGTDPADTITPFELLAQFYEKQNHQALTEDQAAYAQKMMEKIWGE